MFCSSYLFFFFNDTATTEIYTLSLHDALPISREPEGKLRRCLTDAEQSPGTARCASVPHNRNCPESLSATESSVPCPKRSEEHTSELQSRLHLVCRLLLEKKK